MLSYCESFTSLVFGIAIFQHWNWWQ